MSIIEVSGNVITMAEKGLVDIIVHGCNCYHAMGSGIAGQFARKHPEVPAADINGSKYGDLDKIGSFTAAEVQPKAEGDQVFVVFNAYTQKAPSYNGEDVFAYDAFPELLQTIKNQLVMSSVLSSRNCGEQLPPIRLGFPQIGAGLAGGDWPRIRQMIVDTFEDQTEVVVVLVEYQP